MSTLREETLVMPAGELGPQSPLPTLPPPPRKAWVMRIDPSVSPADRKYFGYGGPAPALPYHMQDDYGRRRRKRAFRTVVLENEFLRAEFLIELGGRLWSLRHKPSGRELLYVNPVFQPANLAIRNAWFSGGVEWNIGLRGHCPFTCSPLFAAELRRPDGAPVLRMYEWERVRGVTFQVDACLPEGSPFLLVHVRIVNPHDRTIPMYWWSNSAVPEGSGVRVLTPADSALRTNYAGQISTVHVPPPEGPDTTYPASLQDAADFFYRIPRGRRPWEAALDRGGKGMIQTSTRLLKGRKLFVWGMGPGGRRWQEFLSVPSSTYIEIQAGVARSQYEYIPMPARSQWSWLEAYGLMEAPAREVHSKDAAAARDAVAVRLEKLLPEAAMNAQHARMRAVADAPPARILQRGSGWGALERIRRQRSAEPAMCTPGTPFDDWSLGEDQQPWLALLEGRPLPAREPWQAPGISLLQEPWRKLLESAVRKKKGNSWQAWLHVGTMRYAAGDLKGARKAWERSLARESSWWALRNLAVLARHEDRWQESADLYVQALRLAYENSRCHGPEDRRACNLVSTGRVARGISDYERPACNPSLKGLSCTPYVVGRKGTPYGLIQLAIECFAELLHAGRHAEVLAMVAQSPPAVAARGRVRFLQARAALAGGDWRTARKIVARLEVSDIREGDNAVTDLWFGVHEQRVAEQERVPVDDALRERVRREFPPPRHLDYRMFRLKK
jgi:tetratricopeptide (TPR) repeat protein